MGRANVYLPDDLERRVRAAQIPISEVCQRALLAAVEAAEGGLQPFDAALTGEFQRGWAAGIEWLATAPAEPLLTLLRDNRLAEIPPQALPSDLYSLTHEQALAWEAGFMEAGRSKARSAFATAGQAESNPRIAEAEPDEPTGPEAESSSESSVLGDDSDCRIGVTIDGDPVSFDPHAAVRAGKSPLFAILGQADHRTRLALSVAQDAAARGTGVLLVDLSGALVPRAQSSGNNVRLIRGSQAGLPRLDELAEGAFSLAGLWEAFASFSGGVGLSQMFGGSSEPLIEAGHVTLVDLSGDGQLGAALSIAPLLGQLVSAASFPRLLHIELPVGVNIPSGIADRLGRVVRTARQQNTAVGFSAESAEPVERIGGRGALLSTLFAFATSSPAEADRLRNLFGAQAPILLNPPGTSISPGDETWAVMRDLHGNLGQVRMDGW